MSEGRSFDGFVFFDVFVLLLVVTLTVVCGPAGADLSGHHRTSIALGRRIGPVSYGEPQAQVTRALGRGLATVFGEQGFRSYPVDRIYVAYPPIWVRDMQASVGVTPKSAAIVMTRSPRYRTSSGLGVGSSLRQLHRQITQLDCSVAPGMRTPTKCQDGGPTAATVFSINPKTKRVTQIALVPPAE
jgi:hypothetical protein